MESSISLNSIFIPDLDNNILIQNNYFGWCVTLSYVAFVKLIGPRIMKDRKPFDLRLLMIIYNLGLVFINAFAAFHIIKLALQLWPHRCETWWMHDKGIHWIAMVVYLIKFVELFDTVIFIMRKKFQQISFLHVFHHSAVFTLLWIAYKYKLSGFFGILIGAINSSIHVVLYLYYGLSAVSPSWREYLWWKKYLTTIQIAQFFVGVFYMAYEFLSGCAEFDFYNRIAFASMGLCTVLFLNFYYRNYKVKKQ